jgi:hypothetical protein
MIVWQGAEDTLTSHIDTIHSYQKMAGKAGRRSENARLYSLPAVQHCAGGPGASDVDMTYHQFRRAMTEPRPMPNAHSQNADEHGMDVPPAIRTFVIASACDRVHIGKSGASVNRLRTQHSWTCSR